MGSSSHCREGGPIRQTSPFVSLLLDSNATRTRSSPSLLPSSAVEPRRPISSEGLRSLCCEDLGGLRVGRAGYRREFPSLLSSLLSLLVDSRAFSLPSTRLMQWEYPNNPAEAQAYTSLLRTIREELDEHARKKDGGRTHFELSVSWSSRGSLLRLKEAPAHWVLFPGSRSPLLVDRTSSRNLTFKEWIGELRRDEAFASSHPPCLLT